MAEVRSEILAKLPSTELVVYLVWVPMMGGSAEAAAQAAQRFSDPRIVHFWDGGGLVGREVGRLLEVPGRAGESFGFGWDVYLLYPPGQPWVAPVPKPALWMSGLMLVGPETAPEFDGQAMRAAIERLAPAAR